MSVRNTEGSQPFDEIEITGLKGLQIVCANSKMIKIRGPHVAFSYLPGEIAEVIPDKEEVTGQASKKLITKNRCIVMLGENACHLSDTKWLIVHRLNSIENHCMTLDDACSNEKGEKIWTSGKAPDSKVIRNYLSDMSTKLKEANIFVSFSYSESEMLFTMNFL